MQLQLLHQFPCILLKATGFPTILYNSNHVQTRPEKDSKVTRRQLAEMRKWREEFGQSFRQVTVRNKSTKDNPDTLPINCCLAKLLSHNL